MADDGATDARRSGALRARSASVEMRDRIERELAERIDEVVEVEREIARLHAKRAVLIDAVRRRSENTEVFTIYGATESHPLRRARLVRLALVTELATALRMSEPTVGALIDESEMLTRDLPGTMHALREGTVSYRHAKHMVDQASSLREAAHADESQAERESRLDRDAAAFEAFEEAVLPSAARMTPAQLRQRARRVRERVHPDSIVERRKRAASDRSVTLEAEQDGMSTLSFYGEAPVVSAAFGRVTDIARSLQTNDECRTLTQLRADVFADLLLNGGVSGGGAGEKVSGGAAGLTGGAGLDARARSQADPDAVMGDDVHDVDASADRRAGANETDTAVKGTGTVDLKPDDDLVARLSGIRPTVMVTVPVHTLLGLSDVPATLEGYGPIDPETARILCAQAPSFMRLLTHPEAGAVLSVGRESYAVPADLKRALRVRDGTCRFPGCNKAAGACDIDHTVDWQHGGKTELSNLAHACRTHHKAKHTTGWSVTQDADGALDWTSPSGKTYRTEPEMRIAAPTAEDLLRAMRDAREWSGASMDPWFDAGSSASRVADQRGSANEDDACQTGPPGGGHVSERGEPRTDPMADATDSSPAWRDDDSEAPPF